MRIKNIVLTKMIHDRLCYYEELEREMNSKNEIDNQSERIMEYLENISTLDGMIKVWEDIIKGGEIMEKMTKEE